MLLVKTMLTHPTTQSFTLISARNTNDKAIENTIPSWLLPCMCYLSKCKYPTCLQPYMLCVLGALPTTQPPLLPNLDSKIQLIEFTYCIDRFPIEATTPKMNKYAVLLSLLSQQGWEVLPPIIITIGIRGTIHTPSIDRLQELHISTPKIHKLMEKPSQITIKYLRHIILNKRKLEKKQLPVPLN